MSEEQLKQQFQSWLRTVCFQKPTKEAEDLAWSAVKAFSRYQAPAIAPEKETSRVEALVQITEGGIEIFDHRALLALARQLEIEERDLEAIGIRVKSK